MIMPAGSSVLSTQAAAAAAACWAALRNGSSAMWRRRTPWHPPVLAFAAAPPLLGHQQQNQQQHQQHQQQQEQQPVCRSNTATAQADGRHPSRPPPPHVAAWRAGRSAAPWQQRQQPLTAGGGCGISICSNSQTASAWTHCCSPLLQQCRQFATTTSTSASTSRPRFVLDYVHTQHPGSLPTLQKAEAPAAAAASDPSSAVSCAAASTGDPSSTTRMGRMVAVAVSGGVDSAVSAMLLQQQGYQLIGVYMHNWDSADEAGAGTPTCTSAADLADAKALCRALRIPLFEADFVSRYWNEVFAAFLQGLAAGLTPNPDLACNSHIKFGALLQFAREKGADVLATGHYARLGWVPPPAAGAAAADAGADAAAPLAVPPPPQQQPTQQEHAWQPVLLTGADASKDQTYFLAGLTQQQLAHAMFPVGHLSKAQVRALAAAAGLSQATKRSSAGICFIGRRSFGRFLEAYLQPQPGVYVDADTGAALGPCSNMLAVTVGQKALGLGGQKSRVYVAGKHMARGVVHVAAGHDHPALFSSSVLLQAPNWVAGRPPAALGDAGGGSSGAVEVQFQARYRQAAAPCSVRALSAEQAAGFSTSRFCHRVDVSGGDADAGVGSSVQGPAGQQYLEARLAAPLRGIAPGQMFVMYDGEVCLGSATIVAHGPTLHEEEAEA